MNSLAGEAKFRQRVIRYAQKHGVTKASTRFWVTRKVIYDWKKRYDGQWKSLTARSRRPHSHPSAHTEEEKKLITAYWNKNKDDMMVLWDKLRKNGYNRHYKSMLRVLKQLGLREESKPPKGYKPKPYKRADYPGQKVQIDVKYVPSYCVSNGNKYYQFTAIDECTRLVYREMYEEHSSYSARDFLVKVILWFPFPIREIQTDNGTEFTNALLATKSEHKSLFEQGLEDLGIIYHRIRIATPRHNGKVERQHRIDEERFYKKLRMYSLSDGRKQLAAYNKRSNDIPKVCLNYKSPNEVWELYKGVI